MLTVIVINSMGKRKGGREGAIIRYLTHVMWTSDGFDQR